MVVVLFLVYTAHMYWFDKNPNSPFYKGSIYIDVEDDADYRRSRETSREVRKQLAKQGAHYQIMGNKLYCFDDANALSTLR